MELEFDIAIRFETSLWTLCSELDTTYEMTEGFGSRFNCRIEVHPLTFSSCVIDDD